MGGSTDGCQPFNSKCITITRANGQLEGQRGRQVCNEAGGVNVYNREPRRGPRAVSPDFCVLERLLVRCWKAIPAGGCGNLLGNSPGLPELGTVASQEAPHW